MTEQTTEHAVPATWLDDLQPGDRVAVVRGSVGTTGGLGVKIAVVDRILTRDVVLSDGERFRRDSRSAPVDGNAHLTRREGGTWGWQVRMMHVHDPEVQRTRAHIRRNNAQTAVDTAYAAWRLDRDDDGLLRNLDDAVTTLRHMRLAEQQS